MLRKNVTLLNPGQSIRVGVVAAGDNRDEFIEKTKLSFRVKFSDQAKDHPLSALAQTKQIKPEGGDFVTQALAAGGIKSPALTMATMGVSTENWCVPSDATDGIATIEAETESPSGRKSLKPSQCALKVLIQAARSRLKMLGNSLAFCKLTTVSRTLRDCSLY